jgi:polyisoprenoid-binding protein YceI
MAWTIDSSHSRVAFSVRHMMISNAHGQFNKVNGTVEFDEAKPTNSTVNVQIEAASIDTRDEKRDGHLRSADFFDAEKYPNLTFKSTRVEVTDESHGKLYGDLTIKNVTRPVVLAVDYSGLAKSPWGTSSAGFTATTKISRKDFDLNWNVALETGGVLVGDIVNISIELEIVKQPEAQPATATAA